MPSKTIFCNSCSLLLVICILWASSNANSAANERENMEERYKKWLEKNGKRYRGRDEWELRFQIYQSNVRFIDYVNSLNLSYKLTDNKFADLTNDEFKALYLGTLIDLNITKSHGFLNVTTANLPKQVDWRKKGAVTPVKNQGVCEGCWAFSAIAAVEGLNKIKTGKLVSLSEQELLDCDRLLNDGCQGGLMDLAFAYIEKHGGIATEEDYPFIARDNFATSERLNIPLPKSRVTTRCTENDELSLQAVVAKQSVSVAIDAATYEFQLYSSGVFDGFCGVNLNHGVAVVGYGEQRGKKYWIVKNSWGRKWGKGVYQNEPRFA